MARLIKGYADTRLGQVHCVSAGEGEPLLLLPGAGQTHPMYRGLIGALAECYRVIAVDLPGNGMSARLPPGSSFQSLAAVVTDIMDHAGIDRAHLYGIHTGNKIGAALSANWPDRAGDLIFCGQSHSIIPDQATRNARMREVTARHFPATGTDAAMRAIKLWADAHVQITQMWWQRDIFAVPTGEATRAEAIAGIVDKLQAFESIATLYEANFAYDLQADLVRLTHRTLIVEISTPEEDRAIGRQGDALLKVIPCSRLVTFEEPGGIGLTLEARAGELAGKIHEFLQEVRP